jgi:hypothetical protein
MISVDCSDVLEKPTESKGCLKFNRYSAVIVGKTNVQAPSAMLGGSLVTMAWHILRLHMEDTTSRYEE